MFPTYDSQVWLISSEYYESFFLSCGTVHYAVKDAVLILGTILKCYYQMKASKLYFPTSEVVRRLSYLIVCVVNPEVWLIKTNLVSTTDVLICGFNCTAVQDGSVSIFWRKGNSFYQLFQIEPNVQRINTFRKNTTTFDRLTKSF